MPAKSGSPRIPPGCITLDAAMTIFAGDTLREFASDDVPVDLHTAKGNKRHATFKKVMQDFGAQVEIVIRVTMTGGRFSDDEDKEECEQLSRKELLLAIDKCQAGDSTAAKKIMVALGAEAPSQDTVILYGPLYAKKPVVEMMLKQPSFKITVAPFAYDKKTEISLVAAGLPALRPSSFQRGAKAAKPSASADPDDDAEDAGVVSDADDDDEVEGAAAQPEEECDTLVFASTNNPIVAATHMAFTLSKVDPKPSKSIRVSVTLQVATHAPYAKPKKVCWVVKDGSVVALFDFDTSQSTPLNKEDGAKWADAVNAALRSNQLKISDNWKSAAPMLQGRREAYARDLYAGLPYVVKKMAAARSYIDSHPQLNPGVLSKVTGRQLSAQQIGAITGYAAMARKSSDKPHAAPEDEAAQERARDTTRFFDLISKGGSVEEAAKELPGFKSLTHAIEVVLPKDYMIDRRGVDYWRKLGIDIDGEAERVAKVVADGPKEQSMFGEDPAVTQRKKLCRVAAALNQNVVAVTYNKGGDMPVELIIRAILGILANSEATKLLDDPTLRSLRIDFQATQVKLIAQLEAEAAEAKAKGGRKRKRYTTKTVSAKYGDYDEFAERFALFPDELQIITNAAKLIPVSAAANKINAAKKARR